MKQRRKELEFDNIYHWMSMVTGEIVVDFIDVWKAILHDMRMSTWERGERVKYLFSWRYHRVGF